MLSESRIMRIYRIARIIAIHFLDSPVAKWICRKGVNVLESVYLYLKNENIDI